nr:Mrp/NBP35 family ATP-binding protein [Bacteroidota bacterium]
HQEGTRLKMVPFDKHGIKAISVGLLINEKQALAWRGPMISTALRQLMNDVEWGELDYLIIDMPPGTGDIYLTLVKEFPVTAALIVTTPQQVSVADARKTIEMFGIPGVNVPVIGVVENMSYFSPAELPSKKYYLFGKGGGEKLAKDYNLTLLAQLPLVQKAGEDADTGTPVVLDAESPLQKEFITLAEKVAQYISIINDKGPDGRPV